MLEHWRSTTTYNRGNVLLGMTVLSLPETSVGHCIMCSKLHAQKTSTNILSLASKQEAQSFLRGEHSKELLRSIIPLQKILLIGYELVPSPFLWSPDFAWKNCSRCLWNARLQRFSMAKQIWATLLQRKGQRFRKNARCTLVDYNGRRTCPKSHRRNREITTPARERARILEQNPNRIPIPGYQWADSLSRKEVAKVLGVKHLCNLYRIPFKQASPPRRERKIFLSCQRSRSIFAFRAGRATLDT